MKTLVEYIEYAKGQPHHIRKKIVFTFAGIGTAIVTIVWFFGSLSSGTFALKEPSNANANENANARTNTVTSNDGLAGAASVLSGNEQPARIEIVDSSPAASTTKKDERSIIPF